MNMTFEVVSRKGLQEAVTELAESSPLSTIFYRSLRISALLRWCSVKPGDPDVEAGKDGGTKLTEIYRGENIITLILFVVQG